VDGDASGPGSADGISRRVSLTLPRGRYYRRMWIAPIGLVLFFAFIATLGQLRPLPFASVTDYLGILLFIALLCLLSTGLPRYFRSNRTLVVDGQGARLYRGSREQRFLPWNRITKVQYGPLAQNLMVLGRYHGFELLIGGTRNANSIVVFDAFFDIPEGMLEKAATAVGDIAAKRSIPVSAKPFRWFYG